MKLSVQLDADTITTLVDFGSTHSFISTEATCDLHLELVFHPSLQVTVANGDKVASTGICHNIKFFIDMEAFIMDFFVIPLVGYEMVLGVQWLRTLGPIFWDFTNARMSYKRDDHCIYWHGVAAPGASAVVHTMASTDMMATLLQEFDDVFSVPTGLPPPHRHNHRIHLLPIMVPIVVRPYQYPQLVKDKLEHQCREMLQQGIIRPSTSAFSLPVLLVKNRTFHGSFAWITACSTPRLSMTCFQSRWLMNCLMNCVVPASSPSSTSTSGTIKFSWSWPMWRRQHSGRIMATSSFL
jgi:hypothetical protein